MRRSASISEVVGSKRSRPGAEPAEDSKVVSPATHVVVMLVDCNGSTDDYGGYHAILDVSNPEEDPKGHRLTSETSKRLYRTSPDSRSEFSPETREAFGIDEDGDFSQDIWTLLAEKDIFSFALDHHCVFVVAYQND